MFTPNGIYVIFIVFMAICCVSQSFWLHTEKSLTEVRGGNISLPCNFSVPADAVYWYKHNYTGAPDDEASLVARDFFGYTDPLQGFERFSITNDYSLIIKNITVNDETTFSCLVVDINTERGYTNLRVIALAEPLEPIIEPCNVTAPGRCIYTVGENSPEDVILVCMVYNVRPPPDLTWVRSDGRVAENATQQMQEKDGLFNISSQIQVTKADLDKEYTCEANGDAVNGTSSMEITIIEVSHVRMISRDLITSIVINFVLLILLVSCLIYYKKCGFPGPLGAVKIQKPEPIGDFESQPLADQEEQIATKLSQKIEALENERKEDRASFEEEKREIESNWQKILHDQVEKLTTQELTVTKLSQKMESLENEREEDRASFEEEKREIESNWQKTVNDQVEKLKTQELTVTKLSQKMESLENEREEDRASFEEEKRVIESNRQKTVNDQVEKLMKTQELTVTKLSQKIESLENERKEDRASFKEEQRVVESNWQKTVNDQVEKLKTQELTVTELGQKIEELENKRKEDRISFEEQKRGIELKWQKIVNYHVEMLKTQELAMTKLSQKIEELENKRKKDRASFKEEKREIESNWQKILHDQVEKLKTQELNETELKQKTEAYENEKWKNRAAFVKERLNTQGNELEMITLIIQYHDSGYIKQSHLKVNQHMQLEELKGKLCAKFRIHQSLIHFAHGGQNLSHGGPEDLTTVGLGNLSVLNVSKIF